MMKVKILEPKAYCAGVNRAILLAFKAKEDHPDKDVYVLGMLVHNNFVIDSLNKKDIKTVFNIEEIPNDQVIVFTAHGHDERLDEIAKDKGLIIYDAVCPKVQNNLKLIKKELSESHQIIFIGIDKHPETNAATSLNENVFLYDIHKDFDFSFIGDKNPLVVNQTTLNVLELADIHKNILDHINNARVLDESCSTTRQRQEAIQKIDEKDIDFIIVVGDIKSSNSTRLFEMAKLTHPNIPSIMISDASELDLSLLKDKKSIAISSGASVPNEIIDDIVNKINQLN